MSEVGSQSNSKLQHYDIAIVGGGIVGLSLALSLSRAKASSKLNIVVIDAQEEPENTDELKKRKAGNNYDSRVSALTLASQSFLESLGVWQEITSVGACPYDEMYVWDADGTGSINFAAVDIHNEYLGHIVENSLIVSALNMALMARDNVTILRAETVASIQTNPSELMLNSKIRLSCQLIIGADGANSLIRRQANFKTNEWDYQHEAIVTTVKTQKSHEFRASQCFMNTGPLAFLPLLNVESMQRNEQYYSSIVWSCEPAQAEALMKLNEKDFAEALGRAFENRLGKIEEVSDRYCFPLRQRHSTDYVCEGLALVGDAAHTIHPLAGQGVNLGLLDVQVLSEVINTACERREDYASQQVLSRYQRKRKGGNLSMMLLMEGFKRLFAGDVLLVRWIRNLGLSSVNSLSGVKNHLMRKAMGLD